MHRTTTAREANRRLSAMLRDVQRGATFVVTSRGRSVTRVVLIETAAGRADVSDLLLFLDGLPRCRAAAWSRDDIYA